MKVLPLVGTELRSAIIGMVAGDAHIWKQKECSSVSLRIKHAERQRAYLGYKRDILQNLFKEWEIPIQSFNNSGYSGVKVETRDHPRVSTFTPEYPLLLNDWIGISHSLNRFWRISLLYPR